MPEKVVVVESLSFCGHFYTGYMKGTRMKKPMQFTPFFYSIKVINKLTGEVIEEDFSTGGKEILDVIDRLAVKHKFPVFEIDTTVLTRVVK